MRTWLLVTLIVLLAAPPVAAGELCGVEVEDTAVVDGKTLQLQGMGLRTKWKIKVYVGSLYLERPTSDADEVITSDQTKRVVMSMLRPLDAETIGKGVKKSFFANNSAERMAEIEEELDQLLGLFPSVNKGDQILLTYLPGQGTSVATPDEVRGTVEGKTFADAMFATWFGPKPATEGLKSGMLGLLEVTPAQE